MVLLFKTTTLILVLLEDIADLTVGFVGKTATHYVEKGIRFLRSLNVEPFKINLSRRM